MNLQRLADTISACNAAALDCAAVRLQIQLLNDRRLDHPAMASINTAENELARAVYALMGVYQAELETAGQAVR